MSEQRVEYVPARRVWEMFSVSDRTLDRWLADDRLSFPRPTVLNRRRYFRRDEVEAWAANRRGVPAEA